MASSTITAYTLETWVSRFRSQNNTIDDFAFSNLISDGVDVMIFTERTVLSKYHNELEAYKSSEPMTEAEQDYYAYNPRLFAYEMYTQPELWYLVLYANEMHSMLQFRTSIVKFYSPAVIDLLNSIREIERERLNANAQLATNVILNRSVVNRSDPLVIS